MHIHAYTCIYMHIQAGMHACVHAWMDTKYGNMDNC